MFEKLAAVKRMSDKEMVGIVGEIMGSASMQ
jgi:hypothetical protein